MNDIKTSDENVQDSGKTARENNSVIFLYIKLRFYI